MEVICETCRNPFIIPAARLRQGKGRFCSRKCIRLPRRPAVDRLWSHVIKKGPKDCWLWLGSRVGKKRDHGHMSDDDGKLVGPHQVAFRAVHGKIPEGMWILHTCDNGLCCNPAHLYAGTHADNVRDAVDRDRIAKGEQHGCAKLTEATVLEIYSSKERGVRLSQRLKISQQTICDIRKGRIWSWLTAYESTPPCRSRPLAAASAAVPLPTGTPRRSGRPSTTSRCPR